MITALLAIIGAILNRIRGGWFKDTVFWSSTQTVRAIWAVPTGLLFWAVTGWMLHPFWLAPSLMLSCFLGYALLGHGGHMVFNYRWLLKEWAEPSKYDQTEWTTRWWIIPLFGGSPSPQWPLFEVYLFHILGMGFIGLLRSAIFILPLLISGYDPLPCAVFIALGSLLGIIYAIGWQLHEGIEACELLAGAFYWGTIFTLFGER